MSVDTTLVNRTRQDFSGQQKVWLFGYGSLIYKTGFPYLQRRPASIRGWQRRFWQGSHDHRGTPAHPGRVVTLVPAPRARCQGMAYQIAPEVFQQLDVREKNGYLRFLTPLHFEHGPEDNAVVYIATRDNAAWLGPAPEDAIARQIATSHGPSGANADYLLRLAAALRTLGADDAHVFALEARVKTLRHDLEITA